MNKILISNSSRKTHEFVKSKEVGIIPSYDQEIFVLFKSFEINVPKCFLQVPKCCSEKWCLKF